MKNGFKFFAYYLIIPAFLSILFNDLIKNNLLLSNIIFYLVLLIFFLFCSRKEIINDAKDLNNNFKGYILIILKWIFIEFLLMIFSNYVIGLFIEVLPHNEISNREFINSHLFLSLFYLLFVAPCVEEYVFRFSFRNIKNYWCYILITGLLFTSLHLFSINHISHIWYFIPYFFMSFGFSNIYFKCKNYFASVIGHVIHNALCVIIILLF